MPFRRRWIFYAVFMVLALSGVVWLFDHLTRSSDLPPGLVAPWSMKVHGIAAMLTLFGFGLLWDVHLRRGWAMKKSRVSGGVLGGAMLVLTVSGAGLYYFDGDALRRITEWLHWLVGAAGIALLIWHVLLARRIRHVRQRQAPHDFKEKVGARPASS